MLHRCSAVTRKKRPCPINADAQDENGKWFCHVHNPWGTYQLQVLANRPKRRAKKALGRKNLLDRWNG